MSIKTTLARPYARAAFSEAVQHKDIPAWSKLLQATAVIVRDPQVMMLLQNPRISPEDRLAWLLDICAAYLHPAGRNFLQLLAIKHRLDLLPEIAELFETYRIEQEKTVRVHVTSATPLNNVEQQQLMQALKMRLRREVTLECAVDSALLGGVVLKAGDWVLDDSIRSKLTRLSATLIN
jgi:F-type H+-transporting ATPase subunit delta